MNPSTDRPAAFSGLPPESAVRADSRQEDTLESLQLAREHWDRERAALVQQRDMLAKLLERETRFRAAADAGSQVVYMFRAVRNTEQQIVDFEVVDVSAGGAEMAGRSRDDVIGQRLSIVSPPAMTSGLFDRYVQVAESGIVLDEEYRTRDPRTRSEWLSLHIVPLSPIDDTISVTLRDVSDRKKAEQTKSQLLSVVSHELRTPLTVIHGALGLLAARPDRSPQDAKLVDMATRHTTLLIRLLNDLLDVERIENGATVLQSQLLPAGPLLHHAVELVHRLAEERGVTVKIIRTDAMRDMTVWADPDRVTQVLVNLLNNAVNFSPAGSMITLGINSPESSLESSLESSIESSTAPVQFWVRDEGRGIPADQLDRIFDRFVQIDASDTKDKRGSGLGLALCRAIVDQHGGRIWAESENGRGSTFFFELPRHETTTGATTGAPIQSLTTAPEQLPAR